MIVIDINQLDILADKYGTPFYLMDEEQYLSNLMAFKQAFQDKCKLIVGYSFKTNYVPALCSIAKNAGCYAEVVSEMEYALAKKIGYENIIFNGPIKKTDVLIKAIEENAIVNVDSMYEINTILKYKTQHPNKRVHIGLRLNIELKDLNGNSKIQSGLRVGRFGFSSLMLDSIVPLLKENNIKIVSIHGHTSSSDRAVQNYKHIVSQMLCVCEKFKLDDIQYFNVGGGFFGAPARGINILDKPKYKDYADCILSLCNSSKWFCRINPNIVIEPGVSVTANVFGFVSQIFQKKCFFNKKIITTDGSVFDVKPTFHSNNLPYKFFTHSQNDDYFIGDLVGSTCMEKDIILKDVAIPIEITNGDYVLIEGVGAYTISLTPTFINYLCPIIAIKNSKFYEVRRRQNIDDITSLYLL